MNKHKSLFVIALSNEVNLEEIGIDLSSFDNFVFTGNAKDRNTENIIKSRKKNNSIYFAELNEKYDILFTGIGKINATFFLTQYLYQQINNGFILDVIYNIGTAGGAGSFVNIGDIVLCNNHIQLDMNATPQNQDEIGFTPYDDTIRIFKTDENVKNKILNGIRIIKNNSTKHQFTCATMDKFNIDDTKYDIYDMESYALAKTAYRCSIPFVSIKYITDNITENNIVKNDIFWKQNLQKARNTLTKIIKDIMLSF